MSPVPSAYTAGEASALVAPLVGLTAETISGYIVLALDDAGEFYSTTNAEDDASEIVLISQALYAIGFGQSAAAGSPS